VPPLVLAERVARPSKLQVPIEGTPVPRIPHPYSPTANDTPHSVMRFNWFGCRLAISGQFAHWPRWTLLASALAVFPILI